MGVAGQLADLLQPVGKPIEYLPHQVPPAEGWTGWLMLMGRGSGKSHGLTGYLREAVVRNPKLRARLIGPTLADIIEADVYGPCGILAKDDRVEFRPSSPGGAKLVWPTGAECLLIGIPTKKEVDRLRATGNRECLVAGTLVDSEFGRLPIEEVRVGDRVVTRFGLRSVEAAGAVGLRDTWRLITAAGKLLIGTEDHPLLTDRGWVGLGQLRIGDDLLGPELDEVLVVEQTGCREVVYDLTVEDAHEFVANGLVVHNCDFWEEGAAIPQLEAAWEQAELGRRLGRPRWVMATTPRSKKILRTLQNEPGVVVSTGTPHMNPHNDPGWLEKLERKYRGTRLYRQEVLGEILEDVLGALWRQARLDDTRVGESEVPDLKKKVVGVDPASGSGTTGIVVVGLGIDGHLYVLEDLSQPGRAAEDWGRVAAEAAVRHNCVIVAENDQGGDMVRATLKAAGHNVVVKPARARSVGSKEARATPISMLWERDEPEAHLVGDLPYLEEEMSTWVPGEGMDSPDRLDACLIAGTPVLTDRGLVPIDLVAPGDLVWTREGWRPVDAVRCTSMTAEVGVVRLSDGSTLTGTGDHRVAVGPEWTRLDSLICGDTLSGWKPRTRSSTTASCTAAIRTPSSVTIGCTTSELPISVESSIETSSSTTLGRSRRDTTSTTLTVTPSTTTRRTFVRSPRSSTRPNTFPIEISVPTNGWRTLHRFGRWQSVGTRRKMDDAGIASMESDRGTTGNQRRSSVLSAAKRQSDSSVSDLGSAQTGAVGRLPIENTATTSKFRAQCAERCSGRTSTSTDPRPAAVHVVESFAVEPDRVPVYDLQVRGCHEFVAGSVIVHNCVWACLHLHAGAAWEDTSINLGTRVARPHAGAGLVRFRR